MVECAHKFLYFLDNKPYINMTNACTNRCVFCIRDQKDDVQGANMLLQGKSADTKTVIDEIESDIEKVLKAREIVFCGYGEPLIKLDEVIEISKYIKENYPKLKIRINTNGHANAIHKKNAAALLAPYIDTISISLNAQDEDTYNKVSKPNIENAYEEVKRFIRASMEARIDTIASAVEIEGYGIDFERTEKIAKSLGAKFRLREFIENGYS